MKCFYGFQLLEMNLDILPRAESKLQKRSRLMVSMGLNVNIHLMSSSKIGQFLCSAYLTLFDEWQNITNRGTLSLSDPCAHGVRSLMYETM